MRFLIKLINNYSNKLMITQMDKQLMLNIYLFGIELYTFKAFLSFRLHPTDDKLTRPRDRAKNGTSISNRDHNSSAFYTPQPLVFTTSLSFVWFLPFEIIQAYIERRFALGTTPTVKSTQSIRWPGRPGKPDPVLN